MRSERFNGEGKHCSGHRLPVQLAPPFPVPARVGTKRPERVRRRAMSVGSDDIIEQTRSACTASSGNCTVHMDARA
jgi:hypothetical protein